MRIQLLYNALCHHIRHTGGTREVLIDCSFAEQSRNLTEGRNLRKKKKIISVTKYQDCSGTILVLD